MKNFKSGFLLLFMTLSSMNLFALVPDWGDVVDVLQMSLPMDTPYGKITELKLNGNAQLQYTVIVNDLLEKAVSIDETSNKVQAFTIADGFIEFMTPAEFLESQISVRYIYKDKYGNQLGVADINNTDLYLAARVITNNNGEPICTADFWKEYFVESAKQLEGSEIIDGLKCISVNKIDDGIVYEYQFSSKIGKLGDEYQEIVKNSVIQELQNAIPKYVINECKMHNMKLYYIYYDSSGLEVIYNIISFDEIN